MVFSPGPSSDSANPDAAPLSASPHLQQSLRTLCRCARCVWAKGRPLRVNTGVVRTYYVCAATGSTRHRAREEENEPHALRR
jgi:hypothetical protein